MYRYICVCVCICIYKRTKLACAEVDVFDRRVGAREDAAQCERRGAEMRLRGHMESESVSTSERQDGGTDATGNGDTTVPPTGDPHRGEDPTEDPPPEGRATQGTHTEHTQTGGTRSNRVSRFGLPKYPFGVHPNPAQCEGRGAEMRLKGQMGQV